MVRGNPCNGKLPQILSGSAKSTCLLHEAQPHSVLQCLSVRARPPSNILALEVAVRSLE